MVNYVLDSSAVLAHLLGERGGDFDPDLLVTGKISAVNLSEVITKLHVLEMSAEASEYAVKGLVANSVAFDSDLAVAAGDLRRSTRSRGLSLADRACLALAVREGLPVLTADHAWEGLEIGIEIKLIR
jgi:ribonuclease VapC